MPAPGQEAEEPRIAVVLGLVDDAGVLVDASGFMVEAAQGGKRRGHDRPVGSRRHLEHVTMLPREPVGRADGDLFTGEPAPPGRLAPGAVGVRPAQAHEVFVQADAVAADRQLEGRVAAARPGVIGVGGTRRRGDPGVVPHLVVAHEADPAAAGREGAHAVVAVGRGVSVAHRRARQAEHPVAEARGDGQPREAGIGARSGEIRAPRRQGPVARVPGRPAVVRGSSSPEAEALHEGERGGCGARSGQERATVDRRHRGVSSRWLLLRRRDGT